MRTVAIRRPGWTASFTRPSLSPSSSAAASMSAVVNVMPQKRAGSLVRHVGGFDDLEDRPPDPEERLAERPHAGLALADPAQLDALVLQPCDRRARAAA